MTRLLLLGPPDCEAPSALRTGTDVAWANWPDGSKSMATAYVPSWGPVAHVMDDVTGEPWDPARQFTLGEREHEYGFLHTAHFPRLGLTVFSLDDGLYRAAFTSILVMAGPQDVTSEPSLHWTEDRGAAGFRDSA